MRYRQVKSRITRKIALLVLGSTIFVAVIAIVAGRGTMFQLARLAEDEPVLEALADSQKTIVTMYRSRQQMAQPLLDQCVQKLEEPCSLINVSYEHEILPAGMELGWISENTYIGIDAEQRRHQFVLDWTPLKPKYESITAILSTRLHLSAILPEVASSFLWVFSLALLAALLAGLAISYLFGRNIASRVNSLTAYTRSIASGKLLPAPRVTRGADEIGLLASAMQSMAGELSVAQKKLIVSEKMASWQTVARKVAHEIKNPLTPISLVADELAQRAKQSDPQMAELLRESSRILQEETFSLRRMVHEFSSFARLPEPELESHDLVSVLQEFVAKSCNPDEMTTEVTVEPSAATVVADRSMLEQVLYNLTGNAKHAKSPDIVHVMYHLGELDRSYYIDVMDDAGGVPDELRDRLFDAYVTSRSTGDAEKGMGLGLAISQKIMVDHGGSLTLTRSGENGSCFRMMLPKSFPQEPNDE